MSGLERDPAYSSCPFGSVRLDHEFRDAPFGAINDRHCDAVACLGVRLRRPSLTDTFLSCGLEFSRVHGHLCFPLTFLVCWLLPVCGEYECVSSAPTGRVSLAVSACAHLVQTCPGPLVVGRTCGVSRSRSSRRPDHPSPRGGRGSASPLPFASTLDHPRGEG